MSSNRCAQNSVLLTFWLTKPEDAPAGKQAVHSRLLTSNACIQTPFSEFGSDAADPSVATERDFAKLRRREEKEEKAQRAAFAEYQVIHATMSMSTD